MDNLPQISVILPVYNAEKYISKAIDSILAQTYQNFELIVIDDGSTDNSLNIIKKYETDSKVKIINQENKGLIFTLNKGIALAKGLYIARMDADDISHPERFEKQLRLFKENLNLGVCSTSTENFGAESGVVIRTPKNDFLKAELLFLPPFAHPATMIKRAVLIENNIYYREEFKHCEDFDLWSQLAPYCQFSNVTEVMLKYRVHPEQVTNSYPEVVLNAHFRICQRNLLALGVTLNKRDFLAFIGKEKHCDNIKKIITIYKEIIAANKQNKFYEDSTLKAVISTKVALQIVDFYGLKGLLYVYFDFNELIRYLPLMRVVIGAARRDLINILKSCKRLFKST